MFFNENMLFGKRATGVGKNEREKGPKCSIVKFIQLSAISFYLRRRKTPQNTPQLRLDEIILFYEFLI